MARFEPIAKTHLALKPPIFRVAGFIAAQRKPASGATSLLAAHPAKSLVLIIRAELIAPQPMGSLCLSPGNYSFSPRRRTLLQAKTPIKTIVLECDGFGTLFGMESVR